VSTPARRTAAALGLLLLAGCASSPPKDHPRGTGRPAPAAPAENDTASFDWHPLVVAPFGTRLVDSPIRLHEVLLFQEELRGPADLESKDCYAVDGTPPTFVGRPTDDYLICFEHDRLDRIEASVRIAADDAISVFGQACARWLGNAMSLTKADQACEGRDGDIAFSARLVGVGESGERTAELHLTLSHAANRDAELAPPLDSGAAPAAAP
jgi:hypothetical protein